MKKNPLAIGKLQQTIRQFNLGRQPNERRDHRNKKQQRLAVPMRVKMQHLGLIVLQLTGKRLVQFHSIHAVSRYVAPETKHNGSSYVFCC